MCRRSSMWMVGVLDVNLCLRVWERKKDILSEREEIKNGLLNLRSTWHRVVGCWSHKELLVMRKMLLKAESSFFCSIVQKGSELRTMSNFTVYRNCSNYAQSFHNWFSEIKWKSTYVGLYVGELNLGKLELETRQIKALSTKKKVGKMLKSNLLLCETIACCSSIQEIFVNTYDSIVEQFI